MFTETEEVALWKPYLKSLKKWGSEIFIPVGQSQFLPWCCTTVIPSLFRGHQHILTRFCTHAASMDGESISTLYQASMDVEDQKDLFTLRKSIYTYIICEKYKILLKIVSEEDPTKSAYCLCYASFIFLNIFLMCNLHFPWWLNRLMQSDFFLSYNKYKWWHSHWPHHTVLQTK